MLVNSLLFGIQLLLKPQLSTSPVTLTSTFPTFPVIIFLSTLLLGKDNKWIVNNTTADIVNHEFKREDVLFYNFDYYYWNDTSDKPLFIFTNFTRPLNKSNRKMIRYDIYNCHLDSQGKIIEITNKITHEYEIETLKTGAISYLLTLIKMQFLSD